MNGFEEREREREREREGPDAFLALALGYTLILLLGGPSVASAQTVNPNCPIPVPTPADPGTFGHRWAGLVHDSFTLDGQTVWTGEDGGRIRHRDPSLLPASPWTFQSVPFEVRGRINRLHFLADGLQGWAVSADGWVLRTTNGGANWYTTARLERPFGFAGWEVLFDVWFHPNGDDGWVLGHDGIWFTTDGGVCWTQGDLYSGVTLLDGQLIQQNNMQLWALDIRIEGEDFLGLAVGQPGWILRSVDWGLTWDIVFRAYSDLTFDLQQDPPDCLAQAAQSPIGPGPHFQLWDIELSQDASNPLALVSGGVGNGCGLMLSSTVTSQQTIWDLGSSWSREYHECDVIHGDPGVDCTSYPYQQPPSSPSVSIHWDRFLLLYGLAIDSSDNTAVAVGYGHQLLRRDFLANDTPIWRDRSETSLDFSLLPDQAKVMPLRGVSMAGNPAVAHASGAGGHIRRSIDGGDTWADEPVGEPFRIHDVWFKIDQFSGKQVGWQVGQFFRLAHSDDGGLNWNEGGPARSSNLGAMLNSLAFAADGVQGVVGGSAIPGPTEVDPKEGPRLFWTDNFGFPSWLHPAPITYVPATEEDEHLDSDIRRVCWAKDGSNLHFWAVGSKGLVLRSTDGGADWLQIPLSEDPNHPDIAIPGHLDIDLHGVAATGPDQVIIVGSKGSGPSPDFARAWIWDGTIWEKVRILDTQIELLTDVAVQGSEIRAIGQREHLDGSRSGVLLRYEVFDNNGVPTPRFLVEPGPLHPDEPRNCGIALSGEENRVLNRIAMTSVGDIWLAGQCGVVWQYVAATSTWRDHKSQTDSDFRGMMFVMPQLGFFAAHGGDNTNQVVVRYQESGQ